MCTGTVTGFGVIPMAASDDDRRDDLAATSESLHDDAHRVAEIEEEKQGLEPGDPRLIELSNQAERLADGIAAKSRIERDLADGSGDSPGEEASRPN
jgi:hypothetical protein